MHSPNPNESFAQRTCGVRRRLAAASLAAACRANRSTASSGPSSVSACGLCMRCDADAPFSGSCCRA
eukprot:7391843-Prymnesium_polylepis.3